MSLRRTAATAWRVLRQLRRDPRTLALMMLVPLVLMALLRYMFNDDRTVFDRIAPELIGLFPFVLMFVVTSVAMLRERSSGTLERLLATPVAKLDILIGYALAFAATALVQVGLVLALVLGPLQVTVRGSLLLIVVFAVLDALLGAGLGLCFSALARTEFQAVQLMPALVFPQALLCGLFVPRSAMIPPLQGLANALPLTYAVDGITRAASSTAFGTELLKDLLVVLLCWPLALLVGALTLRRRTP